MYFNFYLTVLVEFAMGSCFLIHVYYVLEKKKKYFFLLLTWSYLVNSTWVNTYTVVVKKNEINLGIDLCTLMLNLTIC